jgi:isoquinoline 1-oxidoreductase beta subunit
MDPHVTGAVTRRAFLGQASGLVLAFHLRLPSARRQDQGAKTSSPPAPDAFLRIGGDGSVTVLLSHSEMGQGIWTTLPMLLAEELGCDWKHVRVEHAPAAPAYFHTAYGTQMTGGSTSTWSEFDRYRQVGAMARTMLVRAAADKWSVEPGACRLEEGFVVNGDRREGLGAFADAAMKAAPPPDVELTPRAKWRLLGKPTRRLDSLAKVTGRAEFGADVRLPGMLTALVARPPVFGAMVKSVREDAALKVPGVRGIHRLPSGVAVVAEHFWAAKTARDLLEIEWVLGPGAGLETRELVARYREIARTPGLPAATAGDVEGRMRAARRTFEAEYEGPYLAHAAMEPLNCTARVGPHSCEVWTGTQMQTLDQANAAKIAKLEPGQVQIHTTFLGGGFGRRASPVSDFVSEAVRLAKDSHAPVKVMWTREDDLRAGWWRPMWLHRIGVGLGQGGMPIAWRQRIVCQSILAGTPFAPMLIKDGIDHTCVEGAADSPYVKDLADHRVELHSPKLEVPVLWWRSVGHSHTAFAMESCIDELAHAAGVDPLDYRRQLLRKHERHLAVLELAASKAGWGKAPPSGHFRGLAVHESFGSYVAHVAEVSVEGKKIRVHKVTIAADCGICANPLGARATLEGAVAFALSAALFGDLTLEKGRLVQSNFHDYPLLRYPDMPLVDTHLVESNEKPGGLGEPGVPTVAPAVANAVFAATGQRLRALPLRLLGLLLSACLSVLGGCGSAAPPDPGAGEPSKDRDRAAALAAFEVVRGVLQHPRCQNCHPRGNAPLQFDAGTPHAQFVVRGEDGKGAVGMRCDACHGTSNPPPSYGPHAPPGAPGWHLPPPETPMVFVGRSSAELASSLADPKQNGGKSLEELLEHVSHDGLVLWGWSPGGDRAPVPTPHAEFVAAFRTWVEAGAPTPPSIAPAR